VGNIGYAKHLEGARTNKATEPRLSENTNTAPEHSTLSFSGPLEFFRRASRDVTWLAWSEHALLALDSHTRNIPTSTLSTPPGTILMVPTQNMECADNTR
jgi:hypothetical protein